MKNKNTPLLKQQPGIEQLFDDLLTTDFPFYRESGNRELGTYGGWGSHGFYPPVNVEENDDHYLMSFDLPGVKKDEVKIEVRGDQLIVSGERNLEHKEGRKGRRYHEWSYGTFQRTFTLPTDMKTEEIEADFKDGILYIAIPGTQTTPITSTHIKLGEGKKKLLGRLTGKKEMAA